MRSMDEAPPRARMGRLALAALTALSLALPAGAADGYYPEPSAAAPRYAAILMDAQSGEVLYASSAEAARYPASITKVMTLYLAFEALEEGRLKLTDELVVSPRAAAQSPSRLGLKPGDAITVDEAIRAVAVKSANDIAVVLAEKIGGTEARFARLMTLRARELGMSNTTFVNASGLPDTRQLSTAHDIAILSRAVMRDHPRYYAYFGLKQFKYRGQAMASHNGLLGKMPGVDGIKTGFTRASGYNLAASAARDGRRLIAVVMGGSSTVARNAEVEDLLLAGFDVLRLRQGGESAKVVRTAWQGAADIYDVDAAYGEGDAEPVPAPRPAVQPVALGPSRKPCADARAEGVSCVSLRLR